MDTTTWPIDAEDKRDAMLRAMLQTPQRHARHAPAPLHQLQDQLRDLLPPPRLVRRQAPPDKA